MELNLKLSDKLNRHFYSRSALEVAPELLGKLFVRIIDGEILAGIIVEVEAYLNQSDMASHSYNGLTKRNAVMFGECGHLYVYFTYGMYYCCNVVTGARNDGQAVLIRGIEPLKGIDIMLRNRFAEKNPKAALLKNITNGPGKICLAFDIDKHENGTDLTANRIFILDYKNIDKNSILTSTRVGIKKSTDLPWRFYLKDNPHVSKNSKR